MSDGYISRQKDIQPRVNISLLMNEKDFKLPSRATFAIVNTYISSEHLSLPRKTLIFYRNCQMYGDMYNQRYMLRLYNYVI